MTIKTKYAAFALLFALCGAIAFGWYLGRTKAQNASNTVLNALNDTISTYEYKLDSITKYAAEIGQIIAEQKAVIEAGVIERKELRLLNIKRLSEVTALKAQVKILIDSVKHTGKVVHIIDTVSNDPFTSVIYLPFDYNEETKYYKLWGGFDTNGIMSHNIEMPVSLGVFTGWDNDKKKYKAVVTSENPYFKVADITSVKVEPRKRITDKGWFKVVVPTIAFGLGVLVGN